MNQLKIFMFNFFKKTASSFLGIDIGTNSIKLVELESVAGRPRLVTYGMVDVDSQVARADNVEASKQDQERIASAIKLLLRKAGARSGSVVAALPNFSVFSSLISLPKLGQKQMAEAIQWEAKKFVPMPIENVVLDWKILNESSFAKATEDKSAYASSSASSASAAASAKGAATDGKTMDKMQEEGPEQLPQTSAEEQPIIAKTEKNLAKCEHNFLDAAVHCKRRQK